MQNIEDSSSQLVEMMRQRSGSVDVRELMNYGQHEEIQEHIESTERLWYKEAVFYEVYVRAFRDSNGDGYGDLRGLTSQLDYLSNLGVNCVWLLPIYPSPLKDDGYDVADYCNVHPHYGTLEDFQTLVNAVHERNMKIIIDFVPNHTSDQHEWFQKARQDRNSPYRDYYVWSDDDQKYKEARIIFVDTEKSNWTWDEQAQQYYWHRFYSSQPDLNYDNPKVLEEMKNVMRFWLNMGIDGFRVDAIPYLYQREGTSCENLPEVHTFLKSLRRMMDTEYSGRVMLAEACQLPHEVREYFGNGDEFHMGFHFPVMPRIYMSIKAENTTSLKDVLAETPQIPSSCQWVTFLRNHDELTLEMVTDEEREWMWSQYAPNPRMKINKGIRRRLAPLFDNDRRQIELAYSMLFTLPGSPIIYYGDEIGMGDNIWLEDRNGVRTPMQWDSSLPNSGFSTAQKLYTPVINTKEYGPRKVNVLDSQNDPSSLYNILRNMINQRRKHQAFAFGSLQWLDNPEKAVAVWIRSYGLDHVLVVSNTSNEPKSVSITIPMKKFRIKPPGVVEVFTKEIYTFDDDVLSLDLRPYQFLWLSFITDSAPGIYPTLMKF